MSSVVGMGMRLKYEFLHEENILKNVVIYESLFTSVSIIQPKASSNK